MRAICGQFYLCLNKQRTIDHSADVGNVRELCLKLKPILGSKMDQIYSAYLAEDNEGRNQIQNYVELLAAKYIPQTLGQPETILLPQLT